MKIKLKNSKITIYKNIERIENILEKYFEPEGCIIRVMAMAILDEFNIPYGRRTEIKPFQDNVQMILEDNKAIIKTKST